MINFLDIFESEQRKLYHLTDDKNFQPNPDYHPENNTTLGGDWPESGIFLAKDPSYWANIHGYWRPWIVEFNVPSNVGQDYGSEVFIPRTSFDKIEITRVLAIDAWCRESFYGCHGWSEEYFGKAFDTGEPHPDGPYPYRGYIAKDVRSNPEAWHDEYPERIKKFRQAKINDY